MSLIKRVSFQVSFSLCFFPANPILLLLELRLFLTPKMHFYLFFVFFILVLKSSHMMWTFSVCLRWHTHVGLTSVCLEIVRNSYSWLVVFTECKSFQLAIKVRVKPFLSFCLFTTHFNLALSTPDFTQITTSILVSLFAL